MKQTGYTCNICRDPFKNRFELTTHLKYCKKGLRPPGKEGDIVCPECQEKFPILGIASHRRAKHGIVGTSRWARRDRKIKAARTENKAIQQNTALHNGTSTSTGTITITRVSVDRKSSSDSLVKGLLAEAACCQADAAELMKKADKLTKMAQDLKELC